MIGFLIKLRYFLLFTDFSLKALIAQWNDKILGQILLFKLVI
jgi:hypothetical protein